VKKVIYLEIDEEITSAIDKIKKTEADSLALVMPKGATLLQSVINLKLLKKQAENHKKDISIVTNDRVGKTIALQVGLSVFGSIDKNGVPQGISEPEELTIKEEKEEPALEETQIVRDNEDNPLVSSKVRDSKAKEAIKQAYYAGEAVNEEESDEAGQDGNDGAEEIPHLERHVINLESEEEAEEENKDEALKAQKGKKRKKEEVNKSEIMSKKKLWLILLGIPLLLVVLGFIFIPKAEITIGVSSEKLPMDTQFKVDREALKVDPQTKIIPGKFFTEDKEESKEFDATGKRDVGDKAIGNVTLYNEYDSDPFKLVQGTALHTLDGKVFKLKNDITIPGATLKSGNKVAGTIASAVEAEGPGEAYNIGPSNFSIPKLDTDQVYARSSGSMSGGFTKQLTVVSKEDFDKAKDSFTKEVTENFQKNVADENKEYRVLKEAVKVEATEAIAEPQISQEAQKFKLKLKVSYKAVMFKDGDLKSLLSKLLEKEVPVGKEVYTSEIDSSKIALISEFDKEFSEADFKFGAVVDLIPKLDMLKIRQSLIFKNTKEVDAKLKEYDSVKEIKFNFWPFAMSKLPLLPSHINVKLDVKK